MAVFRSNHRLCFFGLHLGVLVTLSTLLAIAPGCTEPSPPARAARTRQGPAPERSRTASTPPQQRPVEAPPPRNTTDTASIETRPAQPEPPAPAPAPPPAPVVLDLGVHQVVLLSQAAPGDAPTSLTYVQTTKTSARPVGELLAMLYLPSGASGTENRYTLVYPSKLEAALVTDAAGRIDVPPVPTDTPAPSAAVDVYRWALGRLQTELPDRAHARERLPEVLDGLMRTTAATELGRFERWSAAMIAGTVAAERLYDYERAERCFATAREAAEPGSFEQMAGLYAEARMAVQNGRPDEARRSLETLVARFSALRGCEVFARAEEALAGLPARK